MSAGYSAKRVVMAPISVHMIIQTYWGPYETIAALWRGCYDCHHSTAAAAAAALCSWLLLLLFSHNCSVKAHVTYKE
jgi:hypothetical protein